MNERKDTPQISYADLGEDEKQALRSRVERLLATRSFPRPEDRVRAIRDMLPAGKKHMVLDVYLDVTNRIAYRRLKEDKE